MSLVNINLLPSKLAPDVNVIRLARNLRAFALVGTIIFLVGISAMVFLFVTNTVRLNGIKSRQEKLKSSISSLKPIEQKYVLVKDRSVKIEKILELPNAVVGVESIESILNAAPEGITLSKFQLNNTKSETSFGFTDSKSLSQTLAVILGSGFYDSIVLRSFSFRPESGYSVTLEMENN